MRTFHLIFGLLVLLVFLWTGQLMGRDFPENKDLIPQDLRLLMRSRHIYIVFASVIHIVLGVYLTIREETWRKALQYFGSVILFAASIALVAAFYHETYSTGRFSDISRYGVIASLAGGLFHMVGGFKSRE